MSDYFPRPLCNPYVVLNMLGLPSQKPEKGG